MSGKPVFAGEIFGKSALAIDTKNPICNSKLFVDLYFWFSGDFGDFRCSFVDTQLANALFFRAKFAPIFIQIKFTDQFDACLDGMFAVEPAGIVLCGSEGHIQFYRYIFIAQSFQNALQNLPFSYRQNHSIASLFLCVAPYTVKDQISRRSIEINGFCCNFQFARIVF